MPHLPLGRYRITKGHPFVFPSMFDLRKSLFSGRYQIGIPSRHDQACAIENGCEPVTLYVQYVHSLRNFVDDRGVLN